MRTPQLYSFTKDIANKKYDLGSCDCFAIILDYLDFQRIPYPNEFEGVTRESYSQKFIEDPAEAKTLMISFIDSILPEKDSIRRVAGDLLLIRAKKKGNISLAIDGGNGNVICVSVELGVMTLSVDFYTILKCWSVR